MFVILPKFVFICKKQVLMSEKRPDNPRVAYLSLIAVLILGLVALAVYSYVYDGPSGRCSSSGMRISGSVGEDSPVIYGPEEDGSMLAGLDDSVRTDTVGKHILLFGDSMVEGLSLPLGRYAAQNGHTLTSVVWYSSSSRTWSLTDTLEYFIRKYSPDFIMVSLGGNELNVRDMDERRIYVRDIVARIGSIPFVWIGPPNWRPDTGINDVISENTGDARFFLSRDILLERSDDGRHPSRAGATVWADTIASWIMYTSLYRIRMDRPADGVKSNGRVVVLSNAQI